MSCKYVIGTGAVLDWAVASWREAAPECDIRRVALDQDRSYVFNFEVLAQCAESASIAGTTAFAAIDQRFLNFRRVELFAELKAMGFSMPALISPGAVVSASAVIGENVWIGAGAIIGAGCQVGFNAVIGAGANLGSDSRIGNSAWIEAGVLVGGNAKIGLNATIGHGVILGDGVEVGKLSIIDRPGRVTANVAARTFHHASYANAMVIVGQ
ncbi:MAG: DapH/DapD/GlmU-related protein [Janthinobacterium lividum]